MAHLQIITSWTLALLAALAPAALGQGGNPTGPSGNNLVELYGQGCAGNDGVVPILYPNSNPVIGNAGFALVGDPLPAGASTAYLLFAANHAVVPLGSGCDLLLDPSTLQFLTMPIADERAEQNRDDHGTDDQPQAISRKNSIVHLDPSSTKRRL